MNEYQKIVDKYYKLTAAILKEKYGEVELSLQLTSKDYPKEGWLEAYYKFGEGKYQLELTSTVDKKKKKTILASWTLLQMANCCGACVSTAASVNVDFRKMGLGTLFNQWRIDIARASGYSLLMCTDVIKNKCQQGVLQRNGWKTAHTFLNQRTKNVINISVIGL